MFHFLRCRRSQSVLASILKTSFSYVKIFINVVRSWVWFCSQKWVLFRFVFQLYHKRRSYFLYQADPIFQQHSLRSPLLESSNRRELLHSWDSSFGLKWPPKNGFQRRKQLLFILFLRENSSSKCCGCASKEAPETSGFQATGMFEGNVCLLCFCLCLCLSNRTRHSSLTFPVWAIYFSIHVSPQLIYDVSLKQEKEKKKVLTVICLSCPCLLSTEEQRRSTYSSLTRFTSATKARYIRATCVGIQSTTCGPVVSDSVNVHILARKRTRYINNWWNVLSHFVSTASFFPWNFS